jgi:RimJ/RimL family protein N-acetyltransferase
MMVLSWRYIFYELGMHTMTLQIHEFNKRMLGIAQRLANIVGVKPAGVLRRHVIRDGKPYDSVMYCITRPEIDVLTTHPDLKPLL